MNTIDTQKAQDPLQQESASFDDRSARGTIAALVCREAARLLERSVEPHDDIFDLGAKSLDAVRLAARVSKVLGYEVVSFVSIQLTSQAKATLDAFEASIAALPLVLQSWRLSGEADYLLKCIAPDVEGMHQQLRLFAAMPEVKTIRSLPVLGVAKDAPLPMPGDPTLHPIPEPPLARKRLEGD